MNKGVKIGLIIVGSLAVVGASTFFGLKYMWKSNCADYIFIKGDYAKPSSDFSNKIDKLNFSELRLVNKYVNYAKQGVPKSTLEAKQKEFLLQLKLINNKYNLFV